MAPGARLLALAAAVLSFGNLLAGAAPSNCNNTQLFSIPVSNPQAANAIPNRYIVVYNRTYSDAAVRTHQKAVMAKVAARNVRKRGGHVLSTHTHTYQLGAWRAMALEADDETLRGIAAAGEVAYVEQDTTVQLSSVQTEAVAPAGLARLSSSAPVAAAGGTYNYDSSGGAGITVYVVDTGIRVTHSEFGGRARYGWSCGGGEGGGPDANDDNGHGNHVSGTIGGATYGVAKSATLVAVKVLAADGGGRTSDLIAGINFGEHTFLSLLVPMHGMSAVDTDPNKRTVADNATALGLRGKSVLNMSLSGAQSDAVNEAITAAVSSAGVVAIVAAGNEGADASASSPASADGAFTVGAVDASTDALAPFSNVGPRVDVLAPGVNVLSAGIADDNAKDTRSGTSMACPHVAGLAAYLMALEGITDVAAVGERIKGLAAAVAGGVPEGTTTLIANNGFK